MFHSISTISLIQILDSIRDTTFLLVNGQFDAEDPIQTTETQLQSLNIQLWELDQTQHTIHEFETVHGILTKIIMDTYYYTHIFHEMTFDSSHPYPIYIQYLVTAAALQRLNRYIQYNNYRELIDFTEDIIFDVFYNYSLNRHQNGISDEYEDFLQVNDTILDSPQGEAFLLYFSIVSVSNPHYSQHAEYINQLVHVHNLKQAQDWLEYSIDYCIDPTNKETDDKLGRICEINTLKQTFAACNITPMQFANTKYSEALINTYNLHQETNHPLANSARLYVLFKTGQ
jgi:hypothetical protein